MEQARSRPRRVVASKPRRIVPAIRRSSKGDATRRRILDAAMLVVAKEGYHAATHQRIAQAAGLVRTAINYHFPDQDSLSEALVTHLHQLKSERVTAVIGEALGDDVDRAASAIESYWALLQETPFVAIADMECHARTDAMLRARLAEARQAPCHRVATSPASEGLSDAKDGALRDLSIFLLESLARGGIHQDGLPLERHLLDLLELAERVPASGEARVPEPAEA